MDWKRIDQLREEVGEESLAEVLLMFLEETDEVVRKLDGSINAQTIESDMHFLKGAAMNIGFDSVAALCQTAETTAANGRTSTIAVQPILDNYAKERAELWSHAQELGLVA